MEQAEHVHVVPYGTFVRVWLVLLLLTAILVFTSTIYHQALSVLAMLTLTPIKACLVFFYFMHLKYEKPILKGLVLLTVTLLIVFIGLTFLDEAMR
jgi:cytochrome c oxidase subunit IV